MNCVEAKPIEVILLQPIQRIVNIKIAHRAAVRTIKIDRLSPWSTVSLRKKVWCIQAQVIAFRPEVVINHIEKYHQTFPMCRINQALQVFRLSIASSRRKGQ